MVGLLNHACKVVRAGRSFMRQMLDLLHTVPMHPLRPHPVRLNRGFRSDLAWWRIFIERCNGISFLAPPAHLPTLQLVSDASGMWGCGVWHGSRWFQVQWDQRAAVLQIMVKELIPIVLAGAVWGATVAQSSRAMPLRQPGSGSNSVFTYLQGQPLHALAACTGLY